jgi:hypothetical protein
MQAYQAKLLEIAQANGQFAFEFGLRLAAIRSPPVFFRRDYGIYKQTDRHVRAACERNGCISVLAHRCVSEAHGSAWAMTARRTRCGKLDGRNAATTFACFRLSAGPVRAHQEGAGISVWHWPIMEVAACLIEVACRRRPTFDLFEDGDLTQAMLCLAQCSSLRRNHSKS